jgi:putative effector of murein hydrolase LrgA (UPF0299 family)
MSVSDSLLSLLHRSVALQEEGEMRETWEQFKLGASIVSMIVLFLLLVGISAYVAADILRDLCGCHG